MEAPGILPTVQCRISLKLSQIELDCGGSGTAATATKMVALQVFKQLQRAAAD